MFECSDAPEIVPQTVQSAAAFATAPSKDIGHGLECCRRLDSLRHDYSLRQTSGQASLL